MRAKVSEFTGQACIFCRGPVIGKGVGFHFDVICMKCANKIVEALHKDTEQVVEDKSEAEQAVVDNPTYVCDYCGLGFDDVKKYAIHQRWCKNKKKKDGLKTEALA